MAMVNSGLKGLMIILSRVTTCYPLLTTSIANLMLFYECLSFPGPVHVIDNQMVVSLYIFCHLINLSAQPTYLKKYFVRQCDLFQNELTFLVRKAHLIIL